jgi:benzoate-CoA ligase family protein
MNVHNVSTLIDRNLESGRGGNPALLAGEQTVTYAELARAMARTGHFLHEAGVRREDRVLLILDDTPVFHAAFLGAIRIGAVPVPVNPLDRPDTLAYYLDDSAARAVIADAALIEKIAPALQGGQGVAVAVANGEAGEFVSYERALEGQPDELSPAGTHPDDMAFWLYSSGSTGRPKGVVHLQHDIQVTIDTYARHVLRLTEQDICFSTTKLYHAYGLGNGLSFPFAAGAAAVPVTGRMRPELILEILARNRPTVFFSVPALYAALLKLEDAERGMFSSVRTCVSAAEALPAAILERWRERFGVPILDGVGSTEMLHIYCSNTPEDITPDTSGRPVPGYEMRLVNERGLDVPAGEPGDLLVRGDSCAAFYWHQHEKSKQCMRGEWFYSGDRYVQTPEGRYAYLGRADDMMKIGGLWVSPADLESCLVQHPAVSEAAVIRVSRDDVSRIKAFVICAAPPEDPDALAGELKQWCKANLRRYEYPHLIDFVEDFPRTATGKIQRFKLRDADLEAQRRVLA